MANTYSTETQANITALQKALFAYNPVTYAGDRGGNARGGGRIATDQQIADLSAKLWSDPAARRDQAQITQDFLTHKTQGGLSHVIGKAVEYGVPALVAAGIGAGVAGIAGVGPAAAGGGGTTAASTGMSVEEMIGAHGLQTGGTFAPASAASLAGGAPAASAAAAAVGAAQPGAATGTTGTVAGATAPAAAPAAAAPVTLMSAVKEFGGLALSLGGLLGGGGSQDAKAPDVGAAEAPPGSQAARAPDEAARRRAANSLGDDTLLTSAAGVDPFSLNIGRNKLLGN